MGTSNETEDELDISNLSENWNNALSSLNDIPIGNIAAWSKLQSEDSSINKAIAYMKSGQNPPKTDKVFDMTEIRFYVSNCKYDSTNKILVKEEIIPFNNEMRKRIVVPTWSKYTLIKTVQKYRR